jgi:hypothetical protein
MRILTDQFSIGDDPTIEDNFHLSLEISGELCQIDILDTGIVHNIVFLLLGQRGTRVMPICMRRCNKYNACC